ncbi:MAG: hypothetical protein V4569_01465 [Pseudomonadota bacterium]
METPDNLNAPSRNDRRMPCMLDGPFAETKEFAAAGCGPWHNAPVAATNLSRTTHLDRRVHMQAQQHAAIVET